MARSYYSTVLDEPAAMVWSVIRDFGNYRLWVDGVDDAGIEDGRPGDAVGAIRSVRMAGTRIRQRLLAHSDQERSYTYEFCAPARFPVRDYVASIRVTPIVDGDRTFVEWWATFDAAGADGDHWRDFFVRSFATWLASLRRNLAGDALR
jgi:Polyketide cyclase / dehydrase and lipid transport